MEPWWLTQAFDILRNAKNVAKEVPTEHQSSTYDSRGTVLHILINRTTNSPIIDGYDRRQITVTSYDQALDRQHYSTSSENDDVHQG